MTSATEISSEGKTMLLGLSDELPPAEKKYQQGDIVKIAIRGDVKLLKQCLNNGANVDELDTAGNTALMMAAENGHKAAVNLLIQRKANVDFTRKDGWCALSAAAWGGHKDICEALLKAGADKAKKAKGKTAAQWALQRGHKELAAFIKSWTANYKQGDIIKAAIRGDVKQLEHCVNNGANVDERDSHGNTPLVHAVGQQHKAAVEFLIARKANIELSLSLLKAEAADKNTKYEGNTAAQWAAYKGHTELAELIELWAKPARPLGYGTVQLFKAAKRGDVKQMEQLVNGGANIEALDEGKRTPLIVAVVDGQKPAVDFLIASKANVNYARSTGYCALVAAAYHCRQDICESLRKAGVDKTVRWQGKTAAQWAAEKGSKELAAFIESWGKRYIKGDIITAACKGDVKQLEQCIDNGANIDEQDIDGDTALMKAAFRNHKAAVDFLIARKANVNVSHADGWCALFSAARLRHKSVCEALLKAGADKAAQYNGKTAAQWAAEKGEKRLAAFIESWGQPYIEGDIITAACEGDVKQLEQCIDKGANVDELSAGGDTALVAAAREGRKEAVDFLMARNANVNFARADGWCALVVAAQKGHKDICEALLKAGADKPCVLVALRAAPPAWLPFRLLWP